MKEIVAPDGSILEFPDEMDDNAILGVMNKEYGPKSTATGAALQGAAQGATLGFGDEIQGLMDAGRPSQLRMGTPEQQGRPPGQGITALLGGLGKYLSGDTGGYTAARDEARAADEQAQAEHPLAYGAGEIGGNIAVTAPLAVAGTGATALGTIGRSGLVNGLLGAVQGGGEAKELGDIPRDALTGGAAGAAIGAGAAGLGLGARRLISPAGEIPAARQKLIDTLTSEGVPLTAGQKTNSRFIKYLESTARDMPFVGGSVDELFDKQSEAFTRAALKRVGADAPRATTEVMDDAITRLGNEFDTLAAQTTIKPDQKMGMDLMGVLKDYVDNVGQAEVKPKVQNTIKEIFSRMKTGQIDGEFYKSTRSSIERSARTSKDPEFKDALRSIKDVLDDAVERSFPQGSDLVDRWKTVRGQYRNLIPLERAAAGAGEDVAEGLISPAKLAQTVKQAQGTRNYVRGKGDFADLVRAGQGLLQQPPNSGTPARHMAQALLTAGVPVAAGGAAGYNSTGDWAGTAGGAVAGAGLARLLMSGAGQRILANQVAAGQGKSGQRLVEALLAASARQPVVERLTGP